MFAEKEQKKDNLESESDHSSLKQTLFETLHCLLRLNENIDQIFYYLLILIESFQIFYYVTHPAYPFYKSSKLMSSIHQCISLIYLSFKIFGFQLFMLDNNSIYKIMLPACAGFLLIELILIMLIIQNVQKHKQIAQVNKIYSIVNIMFILVNTILTIPFLGISINVIYCNSESNLYILGSKCYDEVHIAYCFLAAFVLIVLMAQSAIYCYIYFNKNPFNCDFLARNDNNFVVGKFVIKILPIIYLAIDSKMSLINVFSFGLVAVHCAYLFFFRMFSFHDYNEINFYFVYFLESVLAWFSLNNIILFYLDGQKKAGGIIQAFICAIFLSLFILQIEEETYKKVFYQSVESEKIKKQNIEKFFYRLIYMFTHSQNSSDKNQLSALIKILNSKNQRSKVQTSGQNGQSNSNKSVQKQFYQFFKNFLSDYLQGNSNIMLLIMNCYLLVFDDQYSYAFHQSLEISNKKISVSEDLLMYRFRRNARYDKQKLNSNRKQSNNTFMTYYQFNQNLMQLEKQINYCAYNNLDYWEEICQASPSIFKIRNLASKYQEYQQSIDNFYNKIYEIFPNNKQAIKCFIEYFMYIGVNTKYLAKANERYFQAIQNIKKIRQIEKEVGNLIEMGENQNLAYVSIETSEMNFANIKNCNSKFKSMLGFEKHELIDKKINKVIPKSFSQFHDNKIINYLKKREVNEKNKFQRIVYAQNKECLLTEVVLFTKVNYKNIGQKPGLQLIAFLKKIEEKQKSIVLLDLNTQNIIGVNRNFSNLIQNSINPSEYGNNLIKIGSIFSQIDLEKVQAHQNQETTLLFSSANVITKSALNQEVKKKVIIEVESIQEYSDKQKLAYLIIKSNINLSVLSPLKSGQDQDQFQKEQESKNSIQKRCSGQIFSSEVSILNDYQSDYQNKLQNQVDCIGEDQNKYLTIQRKKDQFLKNQHIETYLYLLWSVSVAFILITIGAFIYIFVINFVRASRSQEIKDQIKRVNILTYQTAIINKNTQKMIYKSLYNESEFIQFSNSLVSSINQFQNNYIPLMKVSGSFDYPLQLNEIKYYNVTIFKNSLITQYASETLIDAFFQYISSSKSFIQLKYSDLNNNMIGDQLINDNTFIQQNGKYFFPSVFKKIALKYLDFDNIIFNQYETKQMTINIVYALILICALILIGVSIKKINHFNENVVKLYNQIRLWDANEMKTKCYQFIEARAIGTLKNNSKKRLSSLLNVFPQQLFVKVLDKVQKTEQSNEDKKKYLSFKKKLTHFEEEQNALKEQSNILELQDNNQLLSEEKSHQKFKKHYVFLSEKNKLKKKYIFLTIVSVCFIVTFFIKNQFLHNYEKKTLTINKKINEIGLVRQNLAFINYYSYQLMLNSNQNSKYRQLLKQQISEFYTNTGSCYELIGDPSTILKSSYNMVEEISALIFSQNLNNMSNTTRYSAKNPTYLKQEQYFDENIKLLTELINNKLQNLSETVFSNIFLLNIIHNAVFFLLILVFMYSIKCWMLQEILRNSIKSKSMVLMLPSWLIYRNKGMQKHLQ